MQGGIPWHAVFPVTITCVAGVFILWIFPGTGHAPGHGCPYLYYRMRLKREVYMLDGLRVVLVRPKFPENVGAAARACANMGCPNLVVVSPQRWKMEASLALATPKGAEVLSRLRLEDDLAAALAGCNRVYGTTARTGGWRKGIILPHQAAPEIGESLGQGQEVAVVFGSEDRGLTNEEIPHCGKLIRIPTVDDASSLNLAQAVVIMLYECFKFAPDARPFKPAGPPQARPITHEEQEALYSNLERTLVNIDFIKDANTDYWMLPVRRFLQRFPLRRNEFNLLMGICRQVRWISKKARNGERDGS